MKLYILKLIFGVCVEKYCVGRGYVVGKGK